ncbi:MAG: ABC transporter ATP-binding protein [Candidatus Heimdallarchaeota archaeon]
MKVFTSGLVNKPLGLLNNDLKKKLQNDLGKILKIKKKDIASQELNTFVLVSGNKNQSAQIDNYLFDKVETGNLVARFKKYYKRDETRFSKYLKNNEESKEISHIVRDFVSDIDSNLSTSFKNQMRDINEFVPQMFCDISAKNFVTLWELDEIQEYRFYLAAFDYHIFNGKLEEIPVPIEKLVDKFIIINFLETFLTPTQARLKKMDKVLDLLEANISENHFKSSNHKLQSKFEVFTRVLVAKLGSLQELDNILARIYRLFGIPKVELSQYNIKGNIQDLNAVLNRMSDQISRSLILLDQVSKKIQKCQNTLRDYLNESLNGIEVIQDKNTFKESLAPLTKNIISLFIEVEYLKNWVDYFGYDLPYFSFNTQLFNLENDKSEQISDDVIISVRGLFKNYNLGRTTVYALRGVDLDIKEGEFVAILGSSGVGKTTLLNCMAGLDTADHGKVYFKGEDLQQMKDSTKSEIRLKDMGFIFQSYALLPHINTKENVELPSTLAGTSRKLKQRVQDLLKGVSIDQQANQFPAQLSGGQMQRVAIARALTNKPLVIFADEPTGDLDSVTGKQVMELMKSFHEENKMTIIVITHEKDIAEYAERHIIMEDGVIVSST